MGIKTQRIISRLALFFFVLGAVSLFFSCGSGKITQPVDPKPPVVDIDTTKVDPPDTGEERDDDKKEDTVTVDLPKVDPPKPKPEDKSYTLVPEDYGIVQGKVSGAQALQNRYALERAFREAVEKRVDTFKIGVFDAFFDVHSVTSTTNRNYYSWVEAINIPGDFNLVMGDSTYLRVQPNNNRRYALFSMLSEKNIYVSGGHLIGDRTEHKWSGKGSDEWGHLINISSSQNIVIDGVEMKHANGDGLVVHSREFTFKPNYVPSSNILIKNSRFILNRRQGISLTDGNNITIDGNYFEDTGRRVGNSSGTNPRFAIDCEPYRERDKKTGEVIKYEDLQNITIINNVEKNSERGGFILKAGSGFLVQNNRVQTGITYHHVDNAVIKANIIEDHAGGRVGVYGGSASEFCFDNSIIDNAIIGCDQAIKLYGRRNTVYGNIATGFKSGLTVDDGKDSHVYDNSFISDRPGSYALFLHTTSLDDVLIEKNHFESDRSPAALTSVNIYDGQDGYKFTVSENDFSSGNPFTVDRTQGVMIRGNNIMTGVRLGTSKNIIFDQNRVNAGRRRGFHLRPENINIELTGNIISSKWDCVFAEDLPENFVNENTCKE